MKRVLICLSAVAFLCCSACTAQLSIGRPDTLVSSSPAPVPGHIPEYVPAPAPEQTPEPTPAPTPDPTPTPTPDPTLTPTPVTTPEPTPDPTPGLPEKLYVLMYHHFVPDGETCNEYTMTQSQFREDLQWLTDNGYTFLLPSDLISGAALPEKCVMLTFDDGYTSNYTIAYPLLQEFNAKAVIAVVVSAVEYEVSWAMNWDTCREMQNSGLVEFGSHTFDCHYIDAAIGEVGIKRLPDETHEAYESRVITDLQLSIDILTRELGHPPLYFAYPYGRTDEWAAPFLEKHFMVTTTTNAAPCDPKAGYQMMNRYNINADLRPWDIMD